jgi:hypothetical protein
MPGVMACGVGVGVAGMGGGVGEDKAAPGAWAWDGFFLCVCCRGTCGCGGRETAAGGGGPAGGTGGANGVLLTVEVGSRNGCGAEGTPPEGITEA